MAKHLIIASYDGIGSHYCGVGTIVRNTIYVLNKILEEYTFKISLAFVAIDKSGRVFDQDCMNASINLVEKSNGHLIPLCNGTSGYDEGDMWKSFPEWNAACASLVTSLALILDKDDENMLMIHDTPFLPFSKYRAQLFDIALKVFYLPHSSGLNHQFGDAEWRKKRVQIENDSFSLITQDSDSVLIGTGSDFGQHLKQAYQVIIPDEQYLKNGLCFDQFAVELDNIVSISDLKNFGIDLPPNAKIIFSWGRCSVAKGFRELVNAWNSISDLLPNHYLVLQIPNNSGENDYFQALVEEAATIGRTVILDNFNPQIWRSVLRCQATDMVCIPSLMDPNPHTPIEAKLFCAGMNYCIIASEKDGIKETYQDEECFRFDPYDPLNFPQTILRAAEMTTSDRNYMISLNQRSIRQFDYEKNLVEFLEKMNFLNPAT